MIKNRGNTDSVRTSRDGHTFHDTWTARKSLQLLLRRDDLVGIAVEGLAEEDEKLASPSTVEIADLTLYYGEDANFIKAQRIEILQFKYSTKHADEPFRCYHAKKTLRKFAEAFRNYLHNYGESSTFEKLSFELITNRPIFKNLQEAIDCIADSKSVRGETRKQVEQFKRATELTGVLLKEFATRCRIVGRTGDVASINFDLRNILIDWSATRDALANARLGEIKELVRKKAGAESNQNKVLRQVDVLNALGLSEVEDLLPCDNRFPIVEDVVERTQLRDVVSIVPGLRIPLIVQAEGGVGKTVFVNSLASSLSLNHEVVVFDCFAGGAYRTPEDGRHRPERGLIQIANELACRGLCDPILPGHFRGENLIEPFRKRLSQSVKTLRRSNYDRNLVLIIDAIDNAKRAADDEGTSAFPILLLKSVSITPIPGVIVVASGRTHRIRDCISDISCREIELNSFTLKETTRYLNDRLPKLGLTEIRVAQARSHGNARILEYLVNSDPGMLLQSQIESAIDLDELLRSRIKSALADARKKGYKQREINTFLAGLSLLPPPVPIEEYAGALGFDLGAVRSFSSDMAPLVELQSQGLIFRDEPTETFVRESYGENNLALKRVADNLLSRQGESVYAAQSLPRLLQNIADGGKLFELALDERLPASITSKVGQRKIRHSRLVAAIQHTAKVCDHNRLVHLLVILSSIASSDLRGTNYIIKNPDLVANLNDPDAIRRIHTTRTRWPGSRHARLLVMSLLLNDLPEAARCFTYELSWLRHYAENPISDEFDSPSPDYMDLAAIPFYHLVTGDYKKAVRFLKKINPSYVNEVNQCFFTLTNQFTVTNRLGSSHVLKFIRSFTDEISLISSALQSLTLRRSAQQALIVQLSTACIRNSRSRKHNSSKKLNSVSLRPATILALALGLREEARNLNGRTTRHAPNIWRFTNSPSFESASFLIGVAVDSAVRGTTVSAQDILPDELQSIGKRLRKNETAEELRKKLQSKLRLHISNAKGLEGSKKQYSDTSATDLERYIERYFVQLITFARNLADCFAAPLGRANTPFKNLVEVWESNYKHPNRYSYDQSFVRYFQHLGVDILTYVLEVRRDIDAESIRYFLNRFHKQNYTPTWVLIRITSVTASKRNLANIASEQALLAEKLVNREDDVATRADLFADLARAVLPISAMDANTFFRKGIDQLDAIGSGDFEYTRELLEFASSIRGEEISERSFHTLTNLCELNLTEDSEKFPWGLFCKAMSRTSGVRGLAKLSRWHDREKIELEYTLMPYLKALVEDEKISAEDAVSLNRLACPVELWDLDSESFITTIRNNRPPTVERLIEELICQSEENRRYTSSLRVSEKLRDFAVDELGPHHPISLRIAKEYREYKNLAKSIDSNQTYMQSSRNQSATPSRRDRKEIKHVHTLAAKTNPVDDESLQLSISELLTIDTYGRFVPYFFNKIRQKLRVQSRSAYFKSILENLNLGFHSKVDELMKCKNLWISSSISLGSIIELASSSILDIHCDEFLDSAEMCRYRLREISELTDKPLSALATKLVEIITLLDRNVSASVWLCLGTLICEETKEGKGQEALEVLLQSEASALSFNVEDGVLRLDSYPVRNSGSISADFLWQSLGSPRAKDRWYAAHSIRYFARFGRWNVIDALVSKVHRDDSRSFSAEEVCFYYLHARLWLLITLARLALDYPMHIARHSSILYEIASSDSNAHVCFRHFAARALLECERGNGLVLSSAEREHLLRINESHLPHRSEEENESLHSNADEHRNIQKQRTNEFWFDYDFEKYAIRSLATVFNLPSDRVKEMIDEKVRSLDPNVKDMYDEGGRNPRFHRNTELTSEYELYGQYLAWHGLQFVAAKLLKQYPIANESELWRESWTDWLASRFLTRDDGYWLSDGMDQIPVSANVKVLELNCVDERNLAITGDREKLLSLISIRNGKIGRDLIVYGDWRSRDDVAIHVSSAMVNERNGRKLARDLIDNNDPFSVWLPTPSSDEEHLSLDLSRFEDYRPCIVCASGEATMLERHDPLSVTSVDTRPRFTREIIDHFKLREGDPFRRTWRMGTSNVVAVAEAWGIKRARGNSGESNSRLICKRGFLRKVLEWKKANLILLIELQRYEKHYDSRGGRYSATFAVVRVRKDLKIEYFSGPIDKPQRTSYE